MGRASLQCMRASRFSAIVLLAGLGGCGPGSVEVTERFANVDLIASPNHWSCGVSSTTSRYPDGRVVVSNVPLDAPAMIAAVERPTEQAPVSLRCELDQDDTAVRLELPFPLSKGQTLPVHAASLPRDVADMGPAVDGVGFQFVNRGCPPEAKVVVDGVEVIDASKCDPPIDGTLSGRLVVTSIAPLTLSVDVTLARPDGNGVRVEGALNTNVGEIHSSWTD